METGTGHTKNTRNKRTSVYKTIVAMGGWQPLAMIGLAEIENEFVLRDLLANTPLKDNELSDRSLRIGRFPGN